ncbi:dimethylsulfonioproprionate lyase DddP [Paracoccus onubensis]|uniref:Aminopeptidase P family protein n=1 Tax=Paracoccus onubensis TaxID=1675788 RepID=A0A418T4L5_9RHOB|nr:dimethylsulfonioproprionate lyase DddP [Paracoccus onubensis]RJE88116.1 aminopeptidase P family protein [Paracoccus onubensis]
MSDFVFSDAAPRKIDPARRPATRPDGSPDDNDRVEIGPTPLAFAEWAAAGIACPDLVSMRRYRLNRIVAALHERQLDGVLIYDPLSIRYATDTTNMQLWAAHNPFRACLVTADGHMILWDYDGYDFLSAHNPLVREVRGGASFFYFQNGDRTEEMAVAFADQLDTILQARCGTSRRIAIDKIQIAGLRALDARGFEIFNGEEVMEKARAIKGPDDIAAMRCAIHACEASVAEMRKAARPGVTENDVWAVLHAENIKRGGEWIETRILSSGPRTNPWFQECGPRIIGNNEILAWDTDLIGSYGMCVDISRSWFIGDGAPEPEMRRLHAIAHEHIMTNMQHIRPGVTFKELCHLGHHLTPEFLKNRYTRFHGVGLCDEWPRIPHPIDWESSGYDGVVEEGMMLCVEAYIGSENGPYGIKLEDQVLVTATGCKNMTSCPFDERLS